MIKRLEWDSKFFKKEIGCYNFTDKIDIDLFYENAKNFDLVYLFSNKPIKINAKLMDIKITFSKEVRHQRCNSGQVEVYNNKKNNYNQLLELAYLSGHESRFLKDNFFSKKQFKRMYKVWIDKNLEKDRVLAYYHEMKIAGFISYSMNRKSSSIELIAVHKEFQGKGIGKLLIQSAENSLQENMILKVATQESNQGAYNFYRNYGFSLFQKQFIYHYEPNSF